MKERKRGRERKKERERREEEKLKGSTNIFH